MEVGLVQLLGPVVIAITAAALLVFLPDPDPLTTVVASITLPENVPCLPPFRLIANFSNYHLLNQKVLSTNSTKYKNVGACEIAGKSFDDCQEYKVDYVERLEGMLPLKVYGSAVYRVGSDDIRDDMGGAFESVHETVVGFARVRAEGATEFSWSGSACEVTDRVSVTECPWYARGSCASEPATQRQKVLRNLVTLVEELLSESDGDVVARRYGSWVKERVWALMVQ